MLPMKPLNAKLSLVALCTLPLFPVLPMAAQTKAPVEQLGTVTIHVIDKHGLTLGDCHVERFIDHDGRDMTSHFHGLRGTEIPYGVYTYMLMHEPRGQARQLAQVSAPEQLFVVLAKSELQYGGAFDFAGDGRLNVIRGRLEPAPMSGPQSEPLWVRLSPVHGTDRRDVSVNTTGEFRIFDYMNGRYVLTVVRGDEVLAVQQVSFEDGVRNGDFIVEIPEHPPSVLQVLKK